MSNHQFQSFCLSILSLFSSAISRIEYIEVAGRKLWLGMYKSEVQRLNKLSLLEKCPYLEIFWSVFSRIQTGNGDIRSISPYSVRMRENVDQKNSEYEHFSRSLRFKMLMEKVCGNKAVKPWKLSANTGLSHEAFLKSLWSVSDIARTFVEPFMVVEWMRIC